MKQILFTVALSFWAFTGFAQKKATYCDLNVYKPGFKNYVATVNYGQTPGEKFKAIKNADGKKMRFTSEIGVLNYFVTQGWELVTSYHGKGGETHFFLKK